MVIACTEYVPFAYWVVSSDAIQSPLGLDVAVRVRVFPAGAEPLLPDTVICTVEFGDAPPETVTASPGCAVPEESCIVGGNTIFVTSLLVPCATESVVPYNEVVSPRLSCA